MAKKRQPGSKRRKQPQPDAQPVSEAAKMANEATAELHAEADVIHQQVAGVHKQAIRAHKEAKAIRAKRKKMQGGVLPPRTGVDYDPAEQILGGPVFSSSQGTRPNSILPFTVVGVGASAGGFEAFTSFLSHLPKDNGMAVVLIQHLDPAYESKLGDLLAKVSKTPVIEIRNGLTPEPDHVYVLGSNASVTLQGGRFKLGKRLPPRGPMMPVDVFFRSLAIEQQNRAVGIVLSGMGSDGTLGLQEIKGEGGITFAQDQGSAKHFSMPGSAIAAGYVDFVMSPEVMGEELARVANHPYVADKRVHSERKAPVSDSHDRDHLFRESSDEMRTLFVLLRTRTGVDFSLYKPGTLNRRIMRRMVLHKIDTIGKYVKFLQDNAAEADALFGDLLISVTGFFRDPAAFQTLQRKVLPRLVLKRPDDAPLRIWTCGCSTGEEAYSLAIAVSEFMEKAGKFYPVQIFASDLNDRGLEKARAGLYHENILLDVSPERLRRYFQKVEGFYQVSKTIRDMCVFARQNVVIDPPFSNLDLISCRNVLIYLTPVLQKRVIPIFHYALKPSGFLFLGSSETIGESSELFHLFDKKHKFYTKKVTAYRPAVDLGRYAARDTAPVAAPRPAAPKEEVAITTLQEKVDRLIPSRYSPAAVIINAQMDVLHFRGQTSLFLEHQPGSASLNLLKMVRDELALDVRRAVSKAVQTGDRVEQRSSPVRLGRGYLREVTLEVCPVNAPPETDRYFVVLFRAEPINGSAEEAKSGAEKRSESRTVTKLREELATTKESLQAIIEEQEATNEELKSANEEIQSSNEELQSTNEELETAREELQSTNEELTTLNQELQNRNLELGQVNNDLTNLLNSVNIALIILGTDLTVRRFTPMAEKIFHLIPSDIGRRLSDLSRKIQVADLDASIDDVLENLTVIEREVQDRDGKWYSLRIRPYRTHESRIDGVVLMLQDIDGIRDLTRHLMSVTRHPVLSLHADLRVNRANDAFYRMFQMTPDQTENKSIYHLDGGSWNIQKLRALLEDSLPRQSEIRDVVVEGEFPRIGTRRLSVNARRFHEEGRGTQSILLGLEDITERA